MDDKTQSSGLDAKPDKSPSGGGAARWPWLVAIALIIAAAVALYFYWGEQYLDSSKTAKTGKPGESATSGQRGVPSPPPPSEHGSIVKLGPGQGQQAEQDQRKKPFGLDKSVDAVVRSDESIQVGDKKVPVDELERKLVVNQRGDIREKSLTGQKITAWGVHLVRPDDNLWKIHYVLLREYLGHRGVNLPQDSDQPNPQGYSSGVGKVLKFAEHMVGVYNLRTGKMSHNLNLLEPGQKAVVFNLSEIFAQLSKVDPQDLSGIMYDGRVLFFPKPKAEVTTDEFAPPGKEPPQPAQLPTEN